MKVALSFVALLGTVVRSAAQAAPWGELPAQEFFVPMPEQEMFDDTFKSINANRAEAPVYTMLSVTISADNTVIIYDHHEDDYEDNINRLTQTSTEVWGDGNAANGCRPDITVCNDQNDILTAGTAIVIENAVPVPKKGSDESNYYDGGDRILTNFPVAVTRAAYPKEPGSLMAGGVEVLDTTMWGKEFTAPVGKDQGNTFNGFQYVSIYIMASMDGTEVTLNGVSPVTLMMGDSHIFSVNQNDKIQANKPVQADLITGAEGSYYELRWFSLLPTSKWTNKYLASVGDSVGDTKIVMFNPSTEAQTITYEMWVNEDLHTYTKDVPAGKSEWTNVIPDGTGCYLHGESQFFAISLTDTVGSTQIQDWGYPVMPVEHLTSQVLIGLGFGCTGNICDGHHNTERSVVWVAPMEKANFHVDYNNNGTIDDVFEDIEPYQHVVVNDGHDKDMSGAMIYAVKCNGDFLTGDKVDFAAAWGQKASYAGSNDYHALDLGTVVVPSPSVLVSKTAELVGNDDGIFHPGDRIRYNIKIINMGQADVPANELTIFDDGLDDKAAYVPGSVVYKGEDDQETKIIGDDGTGYTPFPLDSNGPPDTAGVKNQHKISKRGGTHVISFEAIIADRDAFPSEPTGLLTNTGILKQTGRPDKPFENIIEINLTTPRVVVNPDPPTPMPMTASPTTAPVTDAPTQAPVTVAPTQAPVTVAPVDDPDDICFEAGSVYCDIGDYKCDEVNGHAYWTVTYMDPSTAAGGCTDDNTLCIAESDLQYALNHNYVCGPCVSYD